LDSISQSELEKNIGVRRRVMELRKLLANMSTRDKCRERAILKYIDRDLLLDN